MKKLGIYLVMMLFFNLIYSSQVKMMKDDNGNFSHIEKRPALFANELLSYNIGKTIFSNDLFPEYIEQFEQINWNKGEKWLKIAYVHFDPDNLKRAPLSLEDIIQGRVVLNNQEKIPNNFIEQAVTFAFLTLQRDMNASNVLFRTRGKELLPVLVDLEESFRYTEVKGLGLPCLIKDDAINSGLYNDDFNSAPPSEEIKNLVNLISAKNVSEIIDRYALRLTRAQKSRDKEQWFCALEYQCRKYKHLEFLKPLSDQLWKLRLQLKTDATQEEDYHNALHNLEIKITFFNRLEALKRAFDVNPERPFIDLMKDLFRIKPYTKEGIRDSKDIFGNNNFDSDLFSFLEIEQDLITGKSFVEQSTGSSNKQSNNTLMIAAALLSITGIALRILYKKMHNKASLKP